jgi:ribosome-binding protein aMBF1 (putative translation factor)
MQVREKTHHINLTIRGEGENFVASLIREHYPEAEIFKEENPPIEWKKTDLSKEIKAKKTPGKLLRAYRERAGMTIVELAKALHTKYPNISAMENDRRPIGLAVAKKLGNILGVDFKKFLE